MTEGPTLEGLVAAAALAEGGVDSVTNGAETTWRVGGVPFAMVAGGVVELRLDVPIAAAAIRTPDAGASPRGPEWVRFQPSDLDQHAIDRLTAWFALARRRAAAAGATGARGS